MPTEALVFLAGGQVPQNDHAVLARGSHGRAVGRNVHGQHRGLMSGQRMGDFLTACRVPKADGAAAPWPTNASPGWRSPTQSTRRAAAAANTSADEQPRRADEPAAAVRGEGAVPVAEAEVG